jgi:hypothetical protein
VPVEHFSECFFHVTILSCSEKDMISINRNQIISFKFFQEHQTGSMVESIDNKSHGGRRKGAGRKRLGKHLVGFMLTPTVHKALTEAARASGTTKSEYVETAIVEKLGKKSSF